MDPHIVTWDDRQSPTWTERFPRPTATSHPYIDLARVQRAWDAAEAQRLQDLARSGRLAFQPRRRGGVA